MTAPRPTPSRGASSQPVDTLLVARARDFLAGGPATSSVLVAGVCQIPALPEPLAERVAVELLGRYDDFRQLPDGRWTVNARAERSREVGGPLASKVTQRPSRAVPSFEEWRAAREAMRNGEPTHDVEIETRERPERARPGSRTTARAAELALRAAPGDAERLTDLSYVVVDVETTGGAPSRGHRITEVAAVLVQGGEVKEVYETLVNPERSIPPAIMRLTGINAEMLRDRPNFRGVCSDLMAALQGHVFVAHNVNVDWRFVSLEIERATGRRIEGRRLCTVRLARKLLPQLRSRSLGTIADFYGVDTYAQSYFEARHGTGRPWRHSAAGDAVATAHCLLRLLRAAADRGIETWGQLDLWLAGGTGAARRKRRAAMPTPVTKDTTA